VGFSVPVAHRMVAGCDALLMPSRFEPCGLNQARTLLPVVLPLHTLRIRTCRTACYVDMKALAAA
jgi:hypothetical protein